MGLEGAGEMTSLFSMEFLSSVTAMVLVVNLITQVVKEIFFTNNTDKRIPKLINLIASAIVVSGQHYTLWQRNHMAFNNSIIELIFLIFVNSILVTALSMGNYKVLNLSKDKQVKAMQEQLHINEVQIHKMAVRPKEEDGEFR